MAMELLTIQSFHAAVTGDVCLQHADAAFCSFFHFSSIGLSWIIARRPESEWDAVWPLSHSVGSECCGALQCWSFACFFAATCINYC